ncbi:hypothetical protein Gorai_005975 [Gossypium raimondii]|uniref:DUF4283 domain-containing protein n=1 Tax=Gossypium raimondii TaxID=29730 RepID=A0A7J8QDZ7_GOSRA|nr:hypothetical protein [Gossypium raimondii]
MADVVDLNRVIEGMPWFFNNHLLLPHNLQSGEDLVQLPLNNAIFWIQIHDFPPLLMLETMARRGVESNVAGFMELGSDDKDSPI